jgi:hypothetical protein
MRCKAAILAIATAFALIAVTAAEAAPRKNRTVYRDVPGTVVTHRDEAGRTRTKILVQKRSYLDGGTEVMPGDFSGRGLYINPPTHHPAAAFGRNEATNPVGPIPDPWFLPGKNNPWPWFVD